MFQVKKDFLLVYRMVYVLSVNEMCSYSGDIVNIEKGGFVFISLKESCVLDF